MRVNKKSDVFEVSFKLFGDSSYQTIFLNNEKEVEVFKRAIQVARNGLNIAIDNKGNTKVFDLPNGNGFSESSEKKKLSSGEVNYKYIKAFYLVHGVKKWVVRYFGIRRTREEAIKQVMQIIEQKTQPKPKKE